MRSLRFSIVAALLLAVLAFSGVSARLGAQDATALNRRQAALDLTSSLRLLCVAPYPGDEDGAVLALARRGLGARTAVAFVTCGESTPSAVGPEWGEALAVVRVQECEAAAHSLGARALYLDLPDPGPTRDAASVVSRWGEEKLRERLVRVIRDVRPHVVLFTGTALPGASGVREAVLQALPRAIRDAADPACFDDHFQDLLYPWRARRLLEACATYQATLLLDVSQQNSAWGATYTELGARAAALHRSMARPDRGQPSSPATVGYRCVVLSPEAAGEGPKKPPADDLFHGLVGFDQAELGLKKAEDFERVFQVEQQIVKAGRAILAMKDDDPRARTLVAEALAALNRLNEKPLASRQLGIGDYIQEKGYQHFLRQRANELSEALRQVLKIGVQIRVDRKPLSAGQRFALDVKVTTTAPVNVGKLVVLMDPSPTFTKAYVEQRRRELSRDNPVFAYFKGRVLDTAPATLPGSGESLMLRAIPPKLRFTIDGRFEDQHFAFQLTSPAPQVVAPVQIQPEPARVVRRLEDVARDGVVVGVDFRTQGPLFWLGGRPEDSETPLRFKLWAEAPDSIRIEPASIVVRNFRSGDTSSYRFLLKADAPVRGAVVTFHAQLIPEDEPGSRKGFKGSTDLFDFTARVPVDVIEAAVSPAVRVGVVAGHDQTLARALRSLGVNAQAVDGTLDATLGESDPAKRIQVLMVGRDALSVRPDLREKNDALAAFAAAGGTVVFFGQSPRAWNPEPDRAPPVRPSFSLGPAEFVLEDDARVALLVPDHPLFTRPNRLDSRTFEGWKGIAAAPTAPPASWQRLLSVSPGGDHKPLDTAVLVAEHGRGAIVYAALPVRAALEAAVPGAFQWLANLAGFVRER